MRHLLVTGLLILCLGQGVAQRSGDSYDNSLKGTPFKERIMTGGGLGMGFGSDQDFISVSPMIGYRITERMLAGTSITYRYTKYKFFSPAIKLTDYGLSPFVRYTVFNNIFVQAEYEYLNFEFPARHPVTQEIVTTRKDFTGFFAGGGFMQPLGDRAFFFVMALYNFSYTDPKPGEYSPYYSPFVLRAGINIGF
jgi:hypothetical protein